VLDRVSLERQKEYADIVLELSPDDDPNWPDLVEVTARSSSTQVRLRVHIDELELLAVALDNAVTGGSGELYFRPPAAERR
jgi:hypothetical protein